MKKDFKEAEIELNKCKVPHSFHDMSIINMKFDDDKLTIRFSLFEYLDDFGILEKDDNSHVAIVEVIYENINILKLNLAPIVNFRNFNVFGLDEDDNGFISLNLSDRNLNDAFFYMEFTAMKYNWKVIDVISTSEFYEYTGLQYDYVDLLPDGILDSKIYPKWSNLD